MKTYKGMLNVVCCWCLCLSLCSFSLAENATTDKPVVEKPAITQKITPDQKIALHDQKIALQKQKEKEIYDAKMEFLRLSKEQEKAAYNESLNTPIDLEVNSRSLEAPIIGESSLNEKMAADKISMENQTKIENLNSETKNK